jgi:hypothetical protein
MKGDEMMVDEMELVGRLKDVEPLRAEAFEEARTVLRAAMAVGGDPGLAPAGPRRPRRGKTLAAWSTAGLGIAAAVAAVTLIATSASPPRARPAASAPAASRAVNAPLWRLADYIQASAGHLAGNATLVIRDQTNASGQAAGGGADLYTDSGDYYWAPSERGLPEDIAGHDTVGGGVFAREVAAAIYAVNGNLATARERMANAPLSHPGVASSQQKIRSEVQARARSLGRKVVFHTMPNTAAARRLSTDNFIWTNSIDALSAGAGNPLVRAGVLRLLSTVPEVTVTNTTADGQRALTLTAGTALFNRTSQESLTINARTGVPIAYAGGAPGKAPDVSITYRVSRVTLSDVAAGKF